MRWRSPHPHLTAATLPAANIVRPCAPAAQVCLGWYGCIDKHLAKYSALLNREGYACMRGILPSLAVFSPFAWPRRRWAARLLDAVAAADPSGARPLVFYAFSNGALGCCQAAVVAAAQTLYPPSLTPPPLPRP